MARRLCIVTIAGFLLVSGYGCGIKARTYVADRERVDQANTGNFGFVKGEGASMAGRKTRKVYVVEFEREKKPVKTPAKPKVEEITPPHEESARASMHDASSDKTPTVDNSSEIKAATVSVGPTVSEYIVEKDDTLQKISKKVYNSHSKWTKIYDANKDKIKNPNFVKPGTVLTIPQE